MNKTQKNEALLLGELHTRKRISIQEAMELLKVSESTARRLFVSMEEKGACLRGHGCIRILDNDFPGAYVYEAIEGTGEAEKELIADKALQLIKNGDSIFLDAGTTLAKLSLKIAEAVRNKTLRDLTIFTNSLVNLNILKKDTKVNLIGGEYRDNRKDFCGIVTEMAIREICFSKCFVGTDGYSKGVGFTASDFQTAKISRLLIANSEEGYILATKEKFRQSSGICFAREEDIRAVITND